MKRSDINPLPEYFGRYINKCDDVEIFQAIEASIDEVNSININDWKKLDDKTYAEGKWTIKDIIQHLIDVERIFSYRALSFARGEKQQLPSYSEDEYAISANANTRTINALIDELRISHESVKHLYGSFSPDMLTKNGMGFKGSYSVASIGFLLPGHQRWHLDVIKEKYLPLL